MKFPQIVRQNVKWTMCFGPSDLRVSLNFAHIYEQLFKAKSHDIYLTNRFHVAVRLFSNRSQVTSKCGKNKKWHTRRSSYHILTSSVIYCWIRRTATWNLFVLYNNEKPFYFKIFQLNAKAGLLPRLCPAFAPPLQEKRPVDVIYDRFKMKQFHWLLCVAKNRDWLRKIAPLSNMTRWLKTYSESRIELRNPQILKKMLEKSSQFLSSEQPCEPKSLDVALKITGVEKIPSTVNLEAIWFEFWMKGA